VQRCTNSVSRKNRMGGAHSRWVAVTMVISGKLSGVLTEAPKTGPQILRDVIRRIPRKNLTPLTGIRSSDIRQIRAISTEPVLPNCYGNSG
jgi:hypothetical protein